MSFGTMAYGPKEKNIDNALLDELIFIESQIDYS